MRSAGSKSTPARPIRAPREPNNVHGSPPRSRTRPGRGGALSTNPLEGRRLYLCTPDRPDLVAFVSACVRGGVDVVQLREKQLAARDLLARAKILAAACHDLGVPFILNDRPDLAGAAGADGVHVGQDDAPPSVARRILGDRAIVGLSTHGAGELAASGEEAVDYISVGPVRPTPTKPGRPGTGLDYVRLAARQTGGRPFFVTGGVTPATVPAIASAGARRFVVVRYLVGAGGGAPHADAATVEAAARTLRSAIDTAIGSASRTVGSTSGTGDRGNGRTAGAEL